MKKIGIPEVGQGSRDVDALGLRTLEHIHESRLLLRAVDILDRVNDIMDSIREDTLTLFDVIADMMGDDSEDTRKVRAYNMDEDGAIGDIAAMLGAALDDCIDDLTYVGDMIAPLKQ